MIALTTAGAMGGTPASPMPPGFSGLGRTWTSTAGISSMRSSGESWKLACLTPPRSIVIAPRGGRDLVEEALGDERVVRFPERPPFPDRHRQLGDGLFHEQIGESVG